MAKTQKTLGLKGTEKFTISGIKSGEAKTVRVEADNGKDKISFEVNVRIDTPQEVKYFKSGGILQYVFKTKLLPKLFYTTFC